MGEISITIMYALLFISLYFEVFLLISLIGNTKEEGGAPARLPTVAIIVPCYNEEQTLAKTVQSLLALQYPQEKLSILIVNDGSTDATALIADGFARSPQVCVYHKENGGKYTALNFGIEKTQAEIIGCLDADSFVEPSALSSLVGRFEDARVMAVTPAIIVHEPKNLLELIQKAEYTLSIFFRRIFSLIDAQFVTPGPFSLYRRSVFNIVGPFKAGHNTEDMEMAIRLQAHHFKIDNAWNARVYTTVPTTLPALIGQRRRWTYGFLKNSIDYRHLFFRRAYGSLGSIVLPAAFISIFGALFFAGNVVWAIGDTLLAKTIQIETIGLAASVSIPDFSWFFISTKALLFIVIVLILFTGGLISTSKRLLLGESKLFTLDTLYYLCLYGFIAPIWLTSAVYRVAFSRENTWK